MSDDLGLWEPKRTLTLEAAREHSKFIRNLRRLLILFALGLIAALIAVFMQKNQTIEIDDTPIESVRMINPRYSGRSSDGQPYYVTADEAVRNREDQDVLDLKNPVLEFYREEGAAKSTLVAKTGIYNDMDEILVLQDDVILNTDDGNRCDTSFAKIFAATKIVEGDKPVHCEGGFGIIDGNAFQIIDNYETFIFHNGMSAVLEQGQ